MSVIPTRTKRDPRAIDPNGKWTGRVGAADLLGISIGAMVLLQRDKKFMPDCQTCGRIRWRIADCLTMREELRQHLKDTYPSQADDLLLTDT